MSETRDPMREAADEGACFVSLRHRDSNLRLRCNNLVRAGLMRRSGRIEAGHVAYVLTNAGIAAFLERSKPKEHPTHD